MQPRPSLFYLRLSSVPSLPPPTYCFTFLRLRAALLRQTSWSLLQLHEVCLRRCWPPSHTWTIPSTHTHTCHLMEKMMFQYTINLQYCAALISTMHPKRGKACSCRLYLLQIHKYFLYETESLITVAQMCLKMKTILRSIQINCTDYEPWEQVPDPPSETLVNLLALSPQSQKVLSQLLCVWSRHLLSVSAWVFCT